ncbi:hypothetical protein CC78DRAFT_23717 [Lojkania enalia]|uniref:Secreted protein n=1 Tax=Lojkania enalia TaxID=147567 RepID=A0A9P4K476_9PLEO|nr:hypothetical protein CC78DRAFT_23717 [Didymosphaeria enalia]
MCSLVVLPHLLRWALSTSAPPQITSHSAYTTASGQTGRQDSIAMRADRQTRMEFLSFVCLLRLEAKIGVLFLQYFSSRVSLIQLTRYCFIRSLATNRR